MSTEPSERGAVEIETALGQDTQVLEDHVPYRGAIIHCASLGPPVRHSIIVQGRYAGDYRATIERKYSTVRTRPSSKPTSGV